MNKGYRRWIPEVRWNGSALKIYNAVQPFMTNPP
jgi:hypothetical protein